LLEAYKRQHQEKHYGPPNLHSLAGGADQFGQRALWRRRRPVIPSSYAPRAAIKRPNEGDEMAALLLVASLAISATAGANERQRRRCATGVAVAVRYARLAMAVIEIAIIG
jgi:hypothetical protein